MVRFSRVWRAVLCMGHPQVRWLVWLLTQDGGKTAQLQGDHEGWSGLYPSHAAHGMRTVGQKTPECFPIRIGRQRGGQQPEQRQGADDPAIATILAQPRAQIAVSAQGYTRQDGERDRERAARRMGEEGWPSAPAD